MIKIVVPLVDRNGRFLDVLALSKEISNWLLENNITVQHLGGRARAQRRGARLNVYFENEDEAIMFRLRFGV